MEKPVHAVHDNRCHIFLLLNATHRNLCCHIVKKFQKIVQESKSRLTHKMQQYFIWTLCRWWCLVTFLVLHHQKCKKYESVQLTQPLDGVYIFICLAAFFFSIISQHMFCFPHGLSWLVDIDLCLSVFWVHVLFSYRIASNLSLMFLSLHSSHLFIYFQSINQSFI